MVGSAFTDPRETPDKPKVPGQGPNFLRPCPIELATPPVTKMCFVTGDQPTPRPWATVGCRAARVHRWS